MAGVATALLVTGRARIAVPFLPPAAPAGYRVDRSQHYTLYAPSAEALADGAREIRHARETFRHHFGIEPRVLVVFLADDPRDFQSVRFAAFRRPGAGFLPFLTREHLRVTASAAESLAAVVHALPDSADGGIRVVELAGPPAGAPPAFVNDAAKVVGESKALAHEACHTFVAGYADQLGAGRPTLSRGYGHGTLPDWFDEMAATLCESAASRDRRRAQLRANLDARLPLAEFTRMEHPITPARLAALAEAGRASGTPPVEFLSGPEVERALAGTGAMEFYAQAMSLGEFLFARGGPEALRTLAGHLTAGRTLDEALREIHRQLPSVPPTVAELEEQWLRWFQEGVEPPVAR
jgi:hypothetical protein